MIKVFKLEFQPSLPSSQRLHKSISGARRAGAKIEIALHRALTIFETISRVGPLKSVGYFAFALLAAFIAYAAAHDFLHLSSLLSSVTGACAFVGGAIPCVLDWSKKLLDLRKTQLDIRKAEREFELHKTELDVQKTGLDIQKAELEIQLNKTRLEARKTELEVKALEDKQKLVVVAKLEDMDEEAERARKRRAERIIKPKDILRLVKDKFTKAEDAFVNVTIEEEEDEGDDKAKRAGA